MYLKLFGTMFGIGGSIMVALNNGLQSYGFCSFFICSLIYAYTNIKNRDTFSAFLWTFYTMMDAIGIWRYWIR
jgi:hypothetical protein